MCVHVYFCVCGFLDKSKNFQSRKMKFEYIVVYKNSSDKFDKFSIRPSSESIVESHSGNLKLIDVRCKVLLNFNFLT